MVSRALTSFALGLALVACDGADSKPAASAESAPKDVSKKDASKGDDARGADGAVDISPAPADPDTWMHFSSKDDAFEVRFPAAPKKQTFETPNPLGGTIPTTMYMTEQGAQAIGVGVMTIPAATLPDFDVEGGLDGGRDGMVNNIGGTLVSEKQIDFAGHPARAIVAKAEADGRAARIEARLFFAKPRLYQLIVVSEESASSPASKFFESFALLSE